MVIPRPIVVLGPTAAGKSELAVAIGEHIGGQIISADSMQVYRHMNVGTAKPSVQLRRKVTHHLIDVIEPVQCFTVADWHHQTQMLIPDLQDRGIHPIVVGGTNLYIKAMLEGLFEGPPANPQLRAELAEVHCSTLHQRLAKVDPASAQRIDSNDRRRMVRAIEVYQATGKPLSQWQTQWNPPQQGTGRANSQSNSQDNASTYHHNPFIIGLQWSVEGINRRINQRAKQMFFPEPNGIETEYKETLIDETRHLLNADLLGPQSRQALGYKQVIEYLEGRSTAQQAFERTKIMTRRMAKMQRTWMRRFANVHWLPCDDRDTSKIIDEALGALRFL